MSGNTEEFGRVHEHRLIKGGLWLYFVLLILEGALRKWVLPGLAEPLLIIRDPVAIGLYALAFGAGLFPWRPAVLMLGGMAMVSMGFAAVAGAPLEVALYGLRINYLHVPLVFLMPMVLTRRDVLVYGKVVLWTSVPVAWMMLMQYNSSAFGFWNRGVGGSEAGQLDGALGRLRPSGPFSFVTGPVAWFSLATAFLFYGWTNPGRFSKWALMAATAATVLAVPISISRSLLMSVAVVLAFGVVTLARDVSKAWRVVVPVLLVAGLFSLISGEGLTDAFESRWESSTVRHGGIQVSIVDRFFADYTVAWQEMSHAPLFGNGIGLGSNVGARFTTGGVTFLLAEAEWPKIILELGPILGTVFILFRCWLSAHVMLVGLRTMVSEGDSLSWMIGGASFLLLLSGQWGPPTILGFAVFGGGLALAAANADEEDEWEEEEDEEGEEQVYEETGEGDEEEATR